MHVIDTNGTTCVFNLETARIITSTQLLKLH